MIKKEEEDVHINIANQRHPSNFKSRISSPETDVNQLFNLNLSYAEN